jgi:hypothetical protein
MKSSLSSHYSSYLKAALLLIQLVMCFGSPTVALAGDRNPLSPGAVRPGNWNDPDESRQGYLKVYSASDVVRDGDARYFPHTSYVIYTSDGKLFKSVKNHRSADDEIPELVSLPVGSYTVVARSTRGGYAGVLAVIKEDQQTIIHLDLWDTSTELVHN